MSWHALGVGAAWFAGGFVFASLAEYWAHRLLHAVRWLGKTHREHHARGTGQGRAAGVLGLLQRHLVDDVAAVSHQPAQRHRLGAGRNGFALFSAFAHQLQHENPKKCFWMKMPLHYVHHTHNQWHHNFGMALDIWDRVFGTYKPLNWEDRLEPEQVASRRRIWQINWLWGGNAEADRRMEEEEKGGRRKAEGWKVERGT